MSAPPSSPPCTASTWFPKANALGKPRVVGEAGIVADVGDDGQSTGSITIETLGRRAALFNAKLSAAFAEGIDGYLIWEKVPDASNSNYNFNNGRFGVGPSDPLNGVTEQHPEGTESVVLLNPADSLCSGLAVNFQWTIENRAMKSWASSRPYEGVPDGAVRSALEETFLKARQAIESEGFTQGQAGAEGTIALARVCSHERISECAQLYGKSDHDLHAFFGSLDKLVECEEQLWGVAQ